MRNALLILLISLLSLSNTACEKGLAYGDPHAVIVVTPEDWWPELSDSVFAVLAPDVFTLRTERTFRLSHQVPEGIEWQRLQKFKEEVLIGSTDYPWVAEVLATLDDTVTYEVPGIVQAEDVWAKGQYVTLILVDPSDDVPEQVFAHIDEVHAILDERFREGVAHRMFVSGVKESLVDSLSQHAGFTLTLPEVYRWWVTDSLYIFRNDNPDPSELIRQFGVTWRAPIPTGLDTDSLMLWKEAVSEESYTYPQAVDRESLVSRNLMMGDMAITEVRGAWKNPPGSSWPAAGPFIFWSVECPEQDRLYFLDSWLYAPGKDKWEYILQLENILSSFRCGSLTESSMGD
jgi:hypothetical protein